MVAEEAYQNNDGVFDNTWWAAHDARDNTAVLNGLTTTAGTGLQVTVAAGNAIVGGTVVSKGSSTNVNLTTADPTNPRKDVIVMNSSGTISAVAGTAAAITPSGATRFKTLTPAPPTRTANTVILAEVYVAAGATSLVDADIKDRKFLLGQKIFAHDGSGKYVKMSHNSTDGTITTNSGDLYISAAGGDVKIYKSGVGMALSVYDSTGVDYVTLSHDGTDGKIVSSAGNLVLWPAGDVVPDTDSLRSLGTTSLRWSNFFADAATIGGTATITTLSVSGSSTLNAVTSDTITPTTDSTYNLGSNTVRWATIYGDALNIGGTSTLNAVTADTITPTTTTTYNLGSSSLRWATVYGGALDLSGTATVNKLTTNTISTGSGDLTLQPVGGDVLVKVSGTDATLSVYDSAGTDYIRLTHDSTNGTLSTNAGDLYLNAASNTVQVYDGVSQQTLKVWYIGSFSTNITHDGTDGIISTGGAGSDLNLQPITGIVNINTAAVNNYLYAYGSGGVNNISFYHDNTDGNIATSAGNLVLAPAGNVTMTVAVDFGAAGINALNFCAPVIAAPPGPPVAPGIADGEMQYDNNNGASGTLWIWNAMAVAWEAH